MKASKTLTTSVIAAAMVGAISLAYAQTAQEPTERLNEPVATSPEMGTPSEQQALPADQMPAQPDPTAQLQQQQEPQADPQQQTQQTQPPVQADPTQNLAAPAAGNSPEQPAPAPATERAPRADRN